MFGGAACVGDGTLAYHSLAYLLLSRTFHELLLLYLRHACYLTPLSKQLGRWRAKLLVVYGQWSERFERSKGSAVRTSLLAPAHARHPGTGTANTSAVQQLLSSSRPGWPPTDRPTAVGPRAGPVPVRCRWSRRQYHAMSCATHRDEDGIAKCSNKTISICVRGRRNHVVIHDL